MSEPKKFQPGGLKKDLGIKEVFAISTGAMISSGIFVLPAVVYPKAGPAILLAYLFSSLLILPALFSKAELTTAMPKSGGIYFFVTRSFGPLFGTFSGLASWFSLSLKSAFALLGIGIFLSPLLPGVSPNTVKYIAVFFTLVFTVLNIIGVKQSGRFQVILVAFLLTVMAGFVIAGIGKVNINHLIPFNPGGFKSIALVTGMIFISYGGLTKVSAVAEEVRQPGKTVPAGMFAAYTTVSILYLLTILTALGIITPETFDNSLTPLSTAAGKLLGAPGFYILAIAAMLAFITTANAGLMAASRSPLAMARDSLLPARINRVNAKTGTPVLSILLTSGFMISCILFLDLESLVKVASTMKLLLFISVNLSVIFMRQSGLVSYRPSFRAPFYPWLQIIGVTAYIGLITQMGTLPLLISGGFFLISVLWYFIYAKRGTGEKSAFIHMMEKVVNKEIAGDTSHLTDELLTILRERDEVEEDRFDTLIRNAPVLDMKESCTRRQLFDRLGEVVAQRWNLEPEAVRKKLHEREEQASTLIYPGVALPHAIPHIVIEGEHTFDIILVRNKYGITWNSNGEVVYTAFCLIGTKDERNFHLKALMSIAQVLQDPDFHHLWHHARNEEELRSVVLVTKRRR